MLREGYVMSDFDCLPMFPKNFLVIDDDEDDRQWLMEAIQKIAPASRFAVARDGKQAMTMLNDGLTPDLMFVDLNMPVMNGIDFLWARLESKFIYDIPVVVMSTSANPVIKREVGKLGVERYIVKPNTEKALLEAVSTALGSISRSQMHDGS